MLDLINYILLPNAIICKLEVLHDPVPSFVSRLLLYCQVVGCSVYFFQAVILSDYNTNQVYLEIGLENRFHD